MIVVAANLVVAGLCVVDLPVVVVFSFFFFFFFFSGLQSMGGRVMFVIVMAWDAKGDCSGHGQG